MEHDPNRDVEGAATYSELRRLRGTRLLVVGDLMADHYLWGDVDRVSREAPVPVVCIHTENTRLGGAANVAQNLRALGARVHLCGIVGADRMGDLLRQRFASAGILGQSVIVDPKRSTTRKQRVIAHNQQLLRCDWDPPTRSAKTAQALREMLETSLRKEPVDAIIVSDYGKGVVGAQEMRLLRRICADGGPLLLVDPQGTSYRHYREAFCLTPNSQEAAAASKLPTNTTAQTLRTAQHLLSDLRTQAICITRGAQGVLALHAQLGHCVIPTRAREVYDVTGAGDTFISMLSAALAAKLSFFRAVALANRAAGIVVGHLGAVSVRPTELIGETPRTAPILHGAEAIASFSERFHREGKRIVFTNGCFDMLHEGHRHCLESSRAEGDVLIVGMNSDSSVRRLKGSQRPLIPEQERALLLSALAYVDCVVIFGEDTPHALLRAIRPHVLTKGADYAGGEIAGAELLSEWKGTLKLIPLRKGYSTTGLVARMHGTRSVP